MPPSIRGIHGQAATSRTSCMTAGYRASSPSCGRRNDPRPLRPRRHVLQRGAAVTDRPAPGGGPSVVPLMFPAASRLAILVGLVFIVAGCCALTWFSATHLAACPVDVVCVP